MKIEAKFSRFMRAQLIGYFKNRPEFFHELCKQQLEAEFAALARSPLAVMRNKNLGGYSLQCEYFFP